MYYFTDKNIKACHTQYKFLGWDFFRVIVFLKISEKNSEGTLEFGKSKEKKNGEN